MKFSEDYFGINKKNPLEMIRSFFCAPVFTFVDGLMNFCDQDLQTLSESDAVVVTVPGVSRKQESRIETESRLSSFLKSISHLNDSVSRGCLAVKIPVNLINPDVTKQDIDILVRMGIFVLVCPDYIPRELRSQDDLNRMTELCVYLYQRLNDARMKTTIFDSLSDCLHCSEGRYLESQLSSIQRAMMKLSKTDLMSRRSVKQGSRKASNWM